MVCWFFLGYCFVQHCCLHSWEALAWAVRWRNPKRFFRAWEIVSQLPVPLSLTALSLTFKLYFFLPLVVFVFDFLPVPGLDGSFDVGARGVFCDDAFEFEGECSCEHVESLCFDVVDVAEGVVLPEEFLQETLSP
jgi:hypothetical protein